MKMISSKSTLASKQKKAALLIALAIVLLVVAFFVVDYIVHIDSWNDIDGTEYTIKRQDGVYALFDANGYMMNTVVENGKTYYETELGTLVALSNKGEAKIFAVVDPDDGEGVSDYNRLMMYPRIQTSDIHTIRVKNQHGSFSFTRNNDGDVVIKDYESIAYNEEMFAYLQSVCGNTTVMQKLSAEAVTKYGYEEYGLDDPAATITVTTSTGRSHTLYVGKQIVSGNGYYVRLDGREAVYIFNTYIGNAALVPIESYVTPLIVYPVTATNYMFVYNFMVNTVTHNEDGTSSLDTDIALTFWDMADREDTEFQTQAYKITDPNLMMYTPSSDAVNVVMNGFLNMKFIGVKKMGVTDAALKEYGLDKPAKILYYEFEVTDENKKPFYIKNHVYVSNLTENGTYYVTADVYGCSDKENYEKLAAYNHIVEVDRSMLPFMDWTTMDWVEKSYFQMGILVCDRMEFQVSDSAEKIVYDIVQIDTNGDGKADDVEVYLVTADGNKKLAVNNFKTLFLNMLGGKLFGKAKISEEQAEAIIADPANHYLTWTATTTAGNQHTYSYYWLEDGKALLTVDGSCEFYVLTSAVKKAMQDAIDVSKGIKITAVTPYTNIDK